MLFKINQKESIFKLNPELAAVPEFASLTVKQMTVVALVFDYKSPFRQKPQKDRWKLAFLAAGYAPETTKDNTFNLRCREMMDGKHEPTNKAIAKYLSLQFDEDQENLKAIQTQIENIRIMARKEWTDPDDLKKVNGLLLTLSELREEQKKIARSAGVEYGFGEQEEENRNISTIDQVMLDEANEI